ncbi:thiamine pyrophosphokinase [Verticillium dahliae]|nr:thiamine pyrophosphokinase [Verticillium dahliae]
MSEDFEWHPTVLFRQTPDSQPRAPFSLVILNQPLRQNQAFGTLWENGTSIQNNLDAIIGDLDSLLPNVRNHYAFQDEPAEIIHDSDQESTDFTKAVSWARSKNGANVDIVALGGLGGRVDQGISQLHHLYLFQPGPRYEQGRVFLLSGQSLTFLLKPGKHAIHVRDGGGGDVFAKHVGIVPLGEPSVITTHGLEWDVENWETHLGGRISTSNHVLPETKTVIVETTNQVIFTIALAGTE